MSNGSQRLPAFETLEIEDDDARHRRLEAFMHKLDSNRTSATTSSVTFGERKTFAMDPPSELLARVQSFLPQMEASNALILDADPKSIDIEHLTDDMGQYIEMDLGLGVFEQRTDTNTANTTDFDMGSSSSDSSSDSDDSDTDSDSSEEIITAHSTSPRIIKPLPRRSMCGKSASPPKIVVLGEEDFAVGSA